jgi:translation initiation factor 2B subunit (eIF-2B alpha/beta/delta family)
MTGNGSVTEKTHFNDSPSVAVIETVAKLEDSDELDITTPLYDYINPDALDRLLTENPAASVSFEYDSYQVVVEGTGTVYVTEKDGVLNTIGE